MTRELEEADLSPGSGRPSRVVSSNPRVVSTTQDLLR